MTDKRVVVPQGMLEAAVAAWELRVLTIHDQCENIARAALLYQREHSPGPTDEQMADMVTAHIGMEGPEVWEKKTEWMRAKILCEEWTSRMYDAPAEPEVPTYEELLAQWRKVQAAGAVPNQVIPGSLAGQHAPAEPKGIDDLLAESQAQKIMAAITRRWEPQGKIPTANYNRIYEDVLDILTEAYARGLKERK